MSLEQPPKQFPDGQPSVATWITLLIFVEVFLFLVLKELEPFV